MPSLLSLVGKLDASANLPLYLQLQRALRHAIVEHKLDPDDALPPERELAEALSVSRITVRKAIDKLVDEGLLIRRQGAGTFVTSRVEKNFSKLTSFSEDMIARGGRPHSVWLQKVQTTVTPEEAMDLGLGLGTAIYRLNRLRFVDGTPMALEFCILLAACLPSPKAVGDSLYAALAAVGNRPTRALQRLRAIPFNAEQAELLQVTEGAPGLLIERRSFKRDGSPVEFTRSYYRGDAYDFVAEINETE